MPTFTPHARTCWCRSHKHFIKCDRWDTYVREVRETTRHTMLEKYSSRGHLSTWQRVYTICFVVSISCEIWIEMHINACCLLLYLPLAGWIKWQYFVENEIVLCGPSVLVHVIGSMCGLFAYCWIVKHIFCVVSQQSRFHFLSPKQQSAFPLSIGTWHWHITLHWNIYS